MIGDTQSLIRRLKQSHFQMQGSPLGIGASDEKIKMSKTTAVEQQEVHQKFNTEWLKTFEGFENYSDEQAEEELASLKKLANILALHLLNTS